MQCTLPLAVWRSDTVGVLSQSKARQSEFYHIGIFHLSSAECLNGLKRNVLSYWTPLPCLLSLSSWQGKALFCKSWAKHAFATEVLFVGSVRLVRCPVECCHSFGPKGIAAACRTSRPPQKDRHREPSWSSSNQGCISTQQASVTIGAFLARPRMMQLMQPMAIAEVGLLPAVFRCHYRDKAETISVVSWRHRRLERIS